MISTDNTTVVSYNKKQGGTHSHSLLCLVVDFFMWLQAQDIVLRAKHIPKCLNVIADPLYRPNQPITTVWSLHPEIVARIFDIWGAPTVDMFATVHNTLLPQFISLILELQALAIDALSQDWQGRSMYMFPPFPLLNKVIQKLHATQEGEVILIAHWWPSQPWFPCLCVDHPHFFSSMELQRPRIMPVLPQWDLDIVLEALSKPPYEPLREASLKHLTLKAVFLLAMASAGRPEVYSVQTRGAGVTLYFRTKFMRKNQKSNQVNDPWYNPAVPIGESEFGAPNGPVRALSY